MLHFVIIWIFFFLTWGQEELGGEQLTLQVIDVCSTSATATLQSNITVTDKNLFRLSLTPELVLHSQLQ